MSADEYPVLVDDWQFECCGEPFAVGDEVSWTLELIDGSRYPEAFRVSLVGDVVDLELDDVATRMPGMSRRALRRGPLTVAVGSGSPPYSGVLHEEHHDRVPRSLPATRGVVTSLGVCVERFTIQGVMWTAIPGSATTLDVERTPDGFRTGTPEDGVAERETGLLVRLRVI